MVARIRESRRFGGPTIKSDWRKSKSERITEIRMGE
jgi:hypothetical protein